MIISLFCIAVGAAMVVIGHFTFNPLADWYNYIFAVLLFVGFYFVGLILMFAIYCLLALPINKNKEYKKPSHFYRFLYMQALDYITFHANVHCRFKGKDFLPKKKRFLLVCNHKSNFDPMLITKKIGRFDIAFIAKDSLSKIPLVSKVITSLCFMFVKRDDLLQSLSILKRATNYIGEDACSVCVFPEGKRYREPGLGEFHEGFFNVAIKNEAPVVVCTIKGTEKISKNVPWKPTKVKIEVIRVFESEEIAGMPAKQLSDTVRQLMLENLEQQYN